MENLLPTIVTGLVASLSAFGIWKKVKRKYFALAKEGAELIIVVTNAMEDDEITKEEMNSILKEANEFVEKVKSLKKER